MEKPLISIIIPTLNSGKTLKKCLDSVLQQTVIDFEVIIQDSNSIDDTINVITDFHDGRIRLHVEEDNGIFDAMNKAISKTKGKWLYFLGSDDYLVNKNVFANLQRHLLDKSLHFLYGNVNSPDYGDIYDGIFDFEKLKTKNICHQAIFVKRSVFNLIGLFNSEYKSCADWDFNFRCFLHPKIKVMHVDLVVAYYAPNGFSKQNRDTIFAEVMGRNLYAYERKFKPFTYWKKRVFEKILYQKNIKSS